MAGRGKARFGGARQGMGFHQVEQGQVRPGLAWSGTASPGRAWQGIHQVEQGKPGLGAARSGQDWLGLAWEVPHQVEQGEAGTGEPRHGGASRGPVRQGMGFTKVEQAGARPGVAGPGLAWRGMGSIQSRTGLGPAWLGAARQGLAWLGVARQGFHQVEQGEAGTGKPRHGSAWQGLAGPGKAWAASP